MQQLKKIISFGSSEIKLQSFIDRVWSLQSVICTWAKLLNKNTKLSHEYGFKKQH